MLVCLALVSWRNWDNYAQLILFEDPVIWVRIPALIIGAMLIGFLPYFLIHKATRYSMNRKLQKVERQLNDVRALSSPVQTELSSVVKTEQPAPAPPSPVTAPIAVPPGVS